METNNWLGYFLFDLRMAVIVPSEAPLAFEYRSRLPSLATRTPTRVGLLDCGSTSMQFETLIGISFESRPPCGFFWLRFMCL